MKRILDCKLFNNYAGKEYKIRIKHRIFGENEMCAPINEFIDNDEMAGVVVHGKRIYCYKNDGGYKLIEEKDGVVISDFMMKISIVG